MKLSPAPQMLAPRPASTAAILLCSLLLIPSSNGSEVADQSLHFYSINSSGMRMETQLESAQGVAEVPDDTDLQEGEDGAEEEESLAPLLFGRPFALNQLGEPLPPLLPRTEEPQTLIPQDSPLVTELDEAMYLERQDRVKAHEARLAELELEFGVWDRVLTGELMSLGSVLQELGEFDGALAAFTRAAHINRINYGLTSVEQIAPIERMVKTHIALNQWEEADRQQRYAFYIQSRAYDKNDPRLISALDELARWNSLTFRQDGQPLLKLVEAYRLYHAAASLVTVHFGPSDPRYVSYLKEMTQTAFRLAAFGSQAELDRLAVSHDTLPAGAASVSRITRLSGFPEGEQALSNIYQLYSSPGMRSLDDAALRRAQAAAELGDWYLMFNRRQSAFRAYREAYDLLAEAGEDVQRQFFEPLVTLTDFLGSEQSAESLSLSLSKELRQGYVDVSLDVSPYGRPNNVQVVAVEPANVEVAAAAVTRRIRSLGFRPRLEAGEPVPVTNARLRFPFWY